MVVAMNCLEFKSRWQAWLAGETDEVATALEQHVEHCAHCQQLLESANAEGAEEMEQLRAALVEPKAAARVAERVMANLVVARGSNVENTASSMTASSATSASTGNSIVWPAWLTPLLTLVAGFVLAMFILRPDQVKQDPKNNIQTGMTGLKPVAPKLEVPLKTVAHLVAATGRVEMFDDKQQDWIPIDATKTFACPIDSRVRTTPDVRCELTTGDGCTIRMNDKTEVTLRGSSSIELQKGQVWCRSPRETQLEVRVADVGNVDLKLPKSSQPTMWCVGPSCVMTEIEPAGRVQVVNAEGEINVRTAAGEQRLEPGQIAEISNGEVTRPSRHIDPVLSTRWMQPLLIARGPDDTELKERVDKMLAQIGRTKIATLYEQEIRSLGEHGVLPLVRFIQSPLAENDPVRRHAAMEITADLAPVWLIPDLIDLLANPDPYVRRRAAATLHRLTAMDMNMSQEAWQEKPNEQQTTALADWKSWWATHRDQYPSPRVQITRE